MSVINSDTREAWQKLADQVGPDRPSVGKTVTVTSGRKHLGKTGKVFWHGRDKFSGAWQYCTDAQYHLREMVGKSGYRVGIETDSGEKFFIAADKVDVVK